MKTKKRLRRGHYCAIVMSLKNKGSQRRVRPAHLRRQKRQAGKWLEGALQICQCGRHGSGSWVACADTPAAAVDHDDDDIEPNTAIGRRQQFDKEDFVFDLLGSVPASITCTGTIQLVDVVHLPSLSGQG